MTNTRKLNPKSAGQQLAPRGLVVLGFAVLLPSMTPAAAGVVLSLVSSVYSLRTFVSYRLSRLRADNSMSWLYFPIVLFSTWLACMGTFVVS